MHAGSDRPEREEERAPAARRPGRPHLDDGEPDNARRVTFTIAIVVTFLFLLVTAGGIGWFLSSGGPPAEEDTAAGSDADDEAEAAAPATGSGPAPGGEDTVTDSQSGLAYELPGEGWARLGDDQVPAEYSSYTVYGSADAPDAIIVTGTEDLGSLEPVAVSGVRLAVDMVGDLVTDDGDVWVEPSGQADLDGLPAFGATMGNSSEDDGNGYGRFLVVELADDRGAFILGLNTGGGDEATAGIDAAFGSVGLL